MSALTDELAMKHATKLRHLMVEMGSDINDVGNSVEVAVRTVIGAMALASVNYAEQHGYDAIFVAKVMAEALESRA